MLLTELLRTYRPETWGGTRGTNWQEHAHYLWNLDPTYMQDLATHMHKLGTWYHTPVVVDDGVVQDGHHRIITATQLGWYHLPIPITLA